MPTVTLQVNGFGAAYAKHNGTATPPLSRLNCIRHATTVGISHYSPSFQRTPTAVWLSAYRAVAIRCVLDFSQASLTRHQAYPQLESTEKMNLSYWIGMTFAAFAADQVLGVPRTIHASQGAGHRIQKANPKSGSLADLIGQDAAQAWHVIEAKGRQTPPSTPARTAWKAQARTIGSINGAAIATQSYCVGLLSMPCCIEFIDPLPPSGRPPMDLKVDRAKFELEYYRPFIEFLQAGARTIRRDGRSFHVRPIAYDPIDQQTLSIGLEHAYMILQRPRARFRFHVPEIDDEVFYCGTNGIVVHASDGRDRLFYK
jgi:hypothetical protein